MALFKKKEEIVKTAKKEKFSDYIICIVIAVLLIILGSWVGYVFDETSRGKNINYQKAIAYSSEYLNVKGFINAAITAVNVTDSNSRKYAYLGFLGGIIVFAYTATIKSKKRYHRKGEEHGSARWGTNEEKKSIQDSNDFKNNVILASDIFLVIDRKLRSENALSERQKKKRAKNREIQSIKENERKQKLKSEAADCRKKELDKLLKKNSPSGNSGEEGLEV